MLSVALMKLVDDFDLRTHVHKFLAHFFNFYVLGIINSLILDFIQTRSDIRTE
jgi:hypothetical protein